MYASLVCVAKSAVEQTRRDLRIQSVRVITVVAAEVEVQSKGGVVWQWSNPAG